MSIGSLIDSHFKFLDSILDSQALKQEELRLNVSIDTLLEICPSSRFPFITIDHLSGIYPKEPRASLVNSIFDLLSKNRDLILLNVTDLDIITTRSVLERYASEVLSEDSIIFFNDTFRHYSDLRSLTFTGSNTIPSWYLDEFVAKGVVIRLANTGRLRLNLPPIVQRIKDLNDAAVKLNRSIYARKAHAIHVPSPCSLYPLLYKAESATKFERTANTEQTDLATASLASVAAIINKKSRPKQVQQFFETSVKNDNYFREFPFHPEWLVYFSLGKSRHRLKLRRFRDYAEIGTF